MIINSSIITIIHIIITITIKLLLLLLRPPGQTCPYETHGLALQAATDLSSAFLSEEMLVLSLRHAPSWKYDKALPAYAYITLHDSCTICLQVFCLRNTLSSSGFASR